MVPEKTYISTNIAELEHKALNVLVVEDSIMTGADIQSALESAGHKVVAVARSYDEALAAFGRGMTDLIVLDVELDGDKDGIEFGRTIAGQGRVPLVVLTGTEIDEVYQRAKESFIPAAYLTKPFRDPDLIRAVDLAWLNRAIVVPPSDSYSLSPSIFLPVNKGYERINKSEVTYISTQKSTHNTYLHRDGYSTPLLVQQSLGQLERYFSAKNFIRVSRSFLVNLDFVERVEGSFLKMKGSAERLSIPESFKAVFMKNLHFPD